MTKESLRGAESRGRRKIVEGAMTWFRRKKVCSGPEKPEPRSYEEMGELPIEEFLMSRGIDVEDELNNFSEYLERARQAGPTTIVHGSDVPMNGSVHISLGRVVTQRETEKALCK